MDIRYQWKIIEINGTIIHAKELDRYRAGTFAWCFHVVFPHFPPILYPTCSYGPLPVISTELTPFIECIIPFITSYN